MRCQSSRQAPIGGWKKALRKDLQQIADAATGQGKEFAECGSRDKLLCVLVHVRYFCGQEVQDLPFLKMMSGQFLQMSLPGKQSPGRVMEAELSRTRVARRSATAMMREPGIKTLLSPRSVLPAL